MKKIFFAFLVLWCANSFAQPSNRSPYKNASMYDLYKLWTEFTVLTYGSPDFVTGWTATCDGDVLTVDMSTDLHNLDIVINSASKFSVDSTGIVTAAGKINAGNGVDLGTSKTLIGTTAMTIGDNNQTVAINSSDWDIDVTGICTNMGTYNAQTISSTASLTGTLDVAGTTALAGNLTVTKDADVTTINMGTDLHNIDVVVNAASKFSVDSTGAVVAAGAISAGAGVNLGTSQALTGTTAITIGSGSATTAITSSDWAIGATGAMTGIGAITADGIITAGAGVTLPTASHHIWTKGGAVTLATSGTDVACANGVRFWSEIMIPYNVTLTGVSYLVGTVGGTDSVVIQLVNSAGVQVATTRVGGLAGAAALVGTAAQFQSVAFSSTYAATAGVYHVVVQFSGTTAKFRAYPIPGSPWVAGSVAGTWGTKADITPGTTFTADKGPICITY